MNKKLAAAEVVVIFGKEQRISFIAPLTSTGQFCIL